jgi:positive regulator of sigma E activity
MNPTKLGALETIGIALMVLALYLTAMLVIMLISMAHGETSSTLAITAVGAVIAAAVSMALRRYTKQLRKGA